ncbi:hypothetical protein ATEIFO6365_0006007900 [Aspergillus terreus]|uniref:Uncharacterized protein n=1 Tax=Aspergillus terreus TaxID=33178 RepID=A0A5M3YX49_ASPTE|nr:hypothetical protein ATETN484_0005007700 [Aspergillus terreus]GFF16742.1 hypothetical protein ATEIFO6365_0006007900 [Aspergillus terreus]
MWSQLKRHLKQLRAEQREVEQSLAANAGHPFQAQVAESADIADAFSNTDPDGFTTVYHETQELIDRLPDSSSSSERNT